jgi:hypothetical protein
MKHTLLVVLTVVLFAGCTSKKRAPLINLQQQMKDKTEYSILLDDMKIEGNVFDSYFHKYKVIEFQDSIPVSRTTDWLQVDEDIYRKYEPYLGMVLLRKDPVNGVQNNITPPGYNYMGDERYGRWQRDSSGNSFWVWYGQYSLMRSVFGWGSQRVYRNDYDNWNRTRDIRRYSGTQWGTNGKVTQATKKNFF